MRGRKGDLGEPWTQTGARPSTGTHPGWPKDSPSAPVLPGDAEMLTSSSEEETECHCFTDHTYAGPTSPWKKELHPDQKQLEIPRQTSGNDCGVFMLMYSLWLCTDTTFHYSVLDMQSIRRWWCVLLMERFGIEGCMSLEVGGSRSRTHAVTGRTCKLHTERSRAQDRTQDLRIVRQTH
ncbi:uncharacterized protein LOC133645705 isoform X5 [Entelurus aequoreus]|uniref:uncharacterized protein LOC133645705 isoform X5 n=1 Tax=Entelurus aequoreus TaxID=161455 RepID=UPI002B1D7942|nr:uncharacterized protein LOC133645705 isoform X5 [Entelurus aequoreus]